MKVVFTERAYISLLSETAEKVNTETGGIFLGYREGDIWRIVETIDPGPESIFQIAYFEYDQKYVNHLAQKIARLYAKPLELLGLWHRHPGSFDQFSGTDDGTNNKYASLHKDGAISALVNIDPEFRLTMFHVTRPLTYTKIKYSVEKDTAPLCNSEQILNYLSGKTSSIRGGVKKTRINCDLMLSDILKNLADLSFDMDFSTLPTLEDENVDFILQNVEQDLAFLRDSGLELKMTLKGECMQIDIKGIREKFSLNFFINPQSKICSFEYNGNSYNYMPTLFQTIMQEALKEVNDNRHFEIDKNFVRNSLRKIVNL